MEACSPTVEEILQDYVFKDEVLSAGHFGEVLRFENRGAKNAVRHWVCVNHWMSFPGVPERFYTEGLGRRGVITRADWDRLYSKYGRTAKKETEDAAMTVPVTTYEALARVGSEVARARKKHPKPYSSPHEAYGILKEEFDEFFDEVREQDHDADAMGRELVQVAAVAVRSLIDLGLIKPEAATCPA